jgi:hypothetical protein
VIEANNRHDSTYGYKSTRAHTTQHDTASRRTAHTNEPTIGVALTCLCAPPMCAVVEMTWGHSVQRYLTMHDRCVEIAAAAAETAAMTMPSRGAPAVTVQQATRFERTNEVDRDQASSRSQTPQSDVDWE